MNWVKKHLGKAGSRQEVSCSFAYTTQICSIFACSDSIFAFNKFCDVLLAVRGGEALQVRLGTGFKTICTAKSGSVNRNADLEERLKNTLPMSPRFEGKEAVAFFVHIFQCQKGHFLSTG